MNNFHRIWFQNFRQFCNLSPQVWLKIRHTSLFSGICCEIRTNFHKKFSEKMQNSFQKMEKSGNSIFIREKNVDDFWLKFWDWRTVQRSTLCRSRRELSNEYLLDEIGVDTAENEPLEVSQCCVPQSPDLAPVPLDASAAAGETLPEGRMLAWSQYHSNVRIILSGLCRCRF